MNLSAELIAILGLTGLTLVTVAALTVRWFHLHSVGTLSALQTAALRLKAGERAVQVDPRGPKSLRQFTELFNQMSTEVTLRDELLEKRMLARNAELLDALTKLKSTSDMLMQHEKMASLGRLAAGVAHEINNPTGYLLSNLTTLEGYVAYLVRLAAAGDEAVAAARAGAAPSDPAFRDYLAIRDSDDLKFVVGDLTQLLGDSQRGANRIRDIVQGLRNFAHTDATVPVSCDVDQIVRDSLRVVGGKLKGFKVETTYGNPPQVLAVPGRLEQVFVNLFSNAGDALESPGASEKGTIWVHTWNSGDEVFVAVRDNGAGIAPEVRDRIFEPFFTTKEVGAGTGLGLSISLGILEESGGTLTVDSEPGSGVCFTVRLPALTELEDAS
ncbi:MAG: ATP-binding protein [Spirochaetales bacterium]